VRCRVVVALLVLAGCGSADPGSEPPTARARPTATPQAPAPPAAPARTAVVWGVERPARAARRLRRHAGVEAVTIARRGVALLRASRDARGRTVERVRAGYAIPLDVLAVDPRGFPDAPPLGRGDAALSSTAARLRGVEAGATLHLLGGRRLRVAAVLTDAAAHDAEVIVAHRARFPSARAPAAAASLSGLAPAAPDPWRATLIVTLSPAARISPRDLARWAERGSAARIVDGPGPVGPARPGPLKARFGEPAVGLPYGDDWVRLDPAFVRRHLVTRRVPILGAVTCHRAMLPHLRSALAELSRRGLARLVDPGDYAGCYAPRRIRPGGALSLHAWGLAVDLNASTNPFGGRSAQDRRLVRVMRRHGFTWGGDWPTRPDPMHFEYRGG
jgi:hypothetical protein